MVVDRRHLLRNPPTQSGITIDELAMCLQAEERVGQPTAKILDVPVLQNLVGDCDVPQAGLPTGQLGGMPSPGRCEYIQKSPGAPRTIR